MIGAGLKARSFDSGLPQMVGWAGAQRLLGRLAHRDLALGAARTRVAAARAGPRAPIGRVLRSQTAGRNLGTPLLTSERCHTTRGRPGSHVTFAVSLYLPICLYVIGQIRCR